MKVINESGIPAPGGASVSRDFIKNYIKDTKGEFIKVYLFAKYLAENSIEMSVSDISNALGESLDTTLAAITFWVQEKKMLIEGETLRLIDTNKGALLPSDSPKTYSGKEIAQFVANDKVFADLYKKSEQILGKMLSTADINTIFSLYNWLGMDPGVICLLLEFCADNGKTNMKYIEKTAIAWDEENIRTVQDAVSYINRVRRMRTYLGNVIRILGLGDRKLTTTETTKIAGWQQMGMSEEMVARAYEITVMRTGKYALSYMDKILANWAQNDVMTPKDADAFDEKFKQMNRKETKPQEKTAKGNNVPKTPVACTDYDKIAREAAFRAIEKSIRNTTNDK